MVLLVTPFETILKHNAHSKYASHTRKKKKRK